MRSVQALEKSTVRDRRRDLPHLQQPTKAKIADTVELGGIETRFRRNSGKKGQTRLRVACQCGQGQHRRIARDLRVETPADPGQRLVNLNRRAITASLVEEIRRQGGQPKLIWRCVGCAGWD